MGRLSRTASQLSIGMGWMLVQMGTMWGQYNVFPGKCRHMVRKWLRNQFYFSKATTCIRGLVFSHSVAHHAIVAIMITYLTENWKTEELEMAAFVLNVQYGITGVMVIVLAHISDTHKSRFKMIVSTNAAYLLGLILLCIPLMSEQTAAKVYYGAAALLALGEAGREATLMEFMDDQYFSEQNQTPSSDEDYLIRLATRREALWSHPWRLGSLVSIFITYMLWAPATLVGASYLVFLLGYRWYFVRSRIDESTWQSRLEYNEMLAILFPVEQQRGEICIVTRFASSSPLGGQEREQRKKFWPLIKVKGEKWFFVELMAMCSAFIAYSMVDAAGDTFFLEQTSNLDDKVGSLTVKPLYFIQIASVSSFLVSFLYDLLVPKQYWQKATLARIGSGLVCSMLCCFTAWQVERKRLKLVLKDTSNATSMSIMWLVPQFFLAGLMEGLAVDGLVNFLAVRIANTDRLRARYSAAHVTELALGVGRIITAICILAFRKIWFYENINRSRLDKFYKWLTFLCLINVICYVCIFFYLYGNKKSQNSADGENKEIIELRYLVRWQVPSPISGRSRVRDLEAASP
ncbi:unnamed protein product [Malus baccata var. baccata]